MSSGDAPVIRHFGSAAWSGYWWPYKGTPETGVDLGRLASQAGVTLAAQLHVLVADYTLSPAHSVETHPGGEHSSLTFVETFTVGPHAGILPRQAVTLGLYLLTVQEAR